MPRCTQVKKRLMNNKDDIHIYFNDVLIAVTCDEITYSRESKDQKKYRFINLVSGLEAVIYAKSLKLNKFDNIQVEIS